MVNSRDRTSTIALSDNQDKNFINFAYQQGFNDFKNYFIYFFDNYSQNGVLSVNEMHKLNNNQDFKLYQSVINKYAKQLTSDNNANYRFKKASQTAGLDKQQLLQSITLIAITAISLTVSKYLQSSMFNEYIKAFNFKANLSKQAGYNANQSLTDDEIRQTANNLINQKYYNYTIDQRIWLKSDLLNNQVKQAINQALNRGVDDQYINNKLFNYIPSNRNESTNASFKKTGFFIANVLVPAEKGRMEQSATDSVFDDYQVSKFNWINQGDSRVCDDCLDKSANGPYTDETDPGTSHIGDRCYRVPVNANN